MIVEHAKGLLYQERLKNSVRLIGVTISKNNEMKAAPPKEKLEVQLQLPF